MYLTLCILGIMYIWHYIYLRPILTVQDVYEWAMFEKNNTICFCLISDQSFCRNKDDSV